MESKGYDPADDGGRVIEEGGGEDREEEAEEEEEEEEEEVEVEEVEVAPLMGGALEVSREGGSCPPAWSRHSAVIICSCSLVSGSSSLLTEMTVRQTGQALMEEMEERRRGSKGSEEEEGEEEEAVMDMDEGGGARGGGEGKRADAPQIRAGRGRLSTEVQFLPRRRGATTTRGREGDPLSCFAELRHRSRVCCVSVHLMSDSQVGVGVGRGDGGLYAVALRVEREEGGKKKERSDGGSRSSRGL